jgi:hypothetical protein
MASAREEAMCDADSIKSGLKVPFKFVKMTQKKTNKTCVNRKYPVQEANYPK